MNKLALLLLALAPIACSLDLDDDPGADFGDGGKADEGNAPPFKLELAMERPVRTTLTFSDDTRAPSTMMYAKFTLSGPATVTFETSRHDGAPEVDTHLYVYEPKYGSWGHKIASDDTRLAVELDAGSYRLLLRRHGADGTPAIDVSTTCSGPGCTPVIDQTCEDKRYADGTCNVDLACGVPDLDCFQTFADDEAGAQWFAGMEAQLAAAMHRAPRAILPTTDPRYAQARELADRGWAAFRAVRPVGRLGEMRPAVIVIDDPSVNAFVMPASFEAKQAGFAIVVQTGLLAVDTNDDGRLGVMMHELQHALGLHVIPSVAEGLRRFYLASTKGPELIGADQVDDAVARAAWVAWTGHAKDVGAFTNDELGGYPITGSQLGTLLDIAADLGDAQACAPAKTALKQVAGEFAHAVSPLDDSFTPPPAFAAHADAALAELRDHCLANLTGGFAGLLATITHQTRDQVDAGMSAEDHALVDGRHAVDAIAAIARDRRAKMRAVEADFAQQTGRPWSALRFYSREEAADDTSVPVLRGAKLDAAGLAQFFLSFFGPAGATCESNIAAGTVSYGVRYDDDHHGNCFRVAHIRQMASFGAPAAAARRAPVTPAPGVPTGSRWGLPARLDELVVY